MNILVIRHAIAEDREEFKRTGQPDDLRPLTKEGRQKMKAAARGLKQVVKNIDVLATSPLVRAVQTADIVTAAYGGLKAVEVDQLKPDEPPQSLLKWLQKCKGDSTIAVVGHEPHLGMFVSWLLTGLQNSFFELKKGGACLLELDESMRPGRARLLWSLPPAQLRALGED